jgi:tRNA-dihydrouridine synthase
MSDTNTPTSNIKIYAAPLQGFTEAAWRQAHASTFTPATGYLAPFIRVEHGEPRRRDLRDIDPQRNALVRPIPQIIVKDAYELSLLVDNIAALGYKSININMGCPFHPQVKHGRGAGLIANPGALEQIARAIEHYTEIEFSLKMRIGVDSPTQWHDVAPIINSIALTSVTIHPRIARQQYRGEIDFTEFEQMLAAIAHPIIYNGDLVKASDIDNILNRYPQVVGIMIGRGLLAEPWLIEEYTTQTPLSAEQRLNGLLKMHQQIFEQYSATLCGDSQILSKIKPFWEYPSSAIGKKAAKAIAKATSLKAYLQAVASIR